MSRPTIGVLIGEDVALEIIQGKLTPTEVVGLIRSATPGDWWSAEDFRAEVKELEGRLRSTEEERDAVRAETAAYVCAWGEFARWPGLPEIPFWVELADPTKCLDRIQHHIRPEQIEGITRAAEKHIRSILPEGCKIVAGWQDSYGLRAKVTRLTKENDRLMKEVESATEAERDRCIAWCNYGREHAEGDMRQVRDWIRFCGHPDDMED